MRILFPALLLVGFAVAPPSAAAPSAAPSFEPERFFLGRSEGRGVIKIFLSGERQLKVRSNGRVEADGTLVLDQRVEQEGKAPEQRQWRIRKIGSGRYSGTLSDAAGPVAGEMKDNRLRLRYRMKNGLDAEQWLHLEPGGRTATNRMTVRKFGVSVATVNETIRRLD
jgi:hypothetical protein